ncbi:MAG: hypothetical protein ACREQ7_12140, partial [Candidatus Binatia bacterium]
APEVPQIGRSRQAKMVMFRDVHRKDAEGTEREKDFHHRGHEEHEGRKHRFQNRSLSGLRGLRDLRGEDFSAISVPLR